MRIHININKTENEQTSGFLLVFTKIRESPERRNQKKELFNYKANWELRNWKKLNLIILHIRTKSKR